MTIIYLALAWFAGLWLSAQVQQPVGVWLALGGPLAVATLAAVVPAVAQDRPAPALGVWLAAGALLCLGGARYAAAQPELHAGHVAAHNGQADVTLIGTVAAEPERRETSMQARLRVESLALPGQAAQETSGLVLVSTGRHAALDYGMRLRLRGDLQSAATERSLAYAGYLARRDIYSQMRFPEIEILGRDGGAPVMRAILSLKDHARQVIYRQLPDPQASLLSGILLGDDSGLSAELDQQFRQSGLTHIIAISGFNIALLAGALLALTRPFLRPRPAGLMALLGVAVYAVLVGGEASVVRAAIMAGLFISAARLLGRPTFTPAGLFSAGLLMTLVEPRILWDVGFQLSFMATLGLMLYHEPLAQWLQRRLEQRLEPALARTAGGLGGELILATLAAQVLVVPLLLFHFGQLSLVSLPANVLALPAQPGVMIWGGLATLAGLILPALGQILAWVAWLFLSWTIAVVGLLGQLPFAAVPASFGPAALAGWYGLVFGLTWLAHSRRSGARLPELAGPIVTRRAALGASAVVVVLALLGGLSRPDGRLHITFLDVGQGDATLIETPAGRQILVDGGQYPAVLAEHLGRRLPFWDRNLDLVVVTHPDSDHAAGLPEVLQRYRVGALITNGQTEGGSGYQALLSVAAGRGVPLRTVQAGEVIQLGDALRLEVLRPPGEVGTPDGRRHDNSRSLVLRLVYGSFSLLLPGDAELAAERQLLASGRDLRAFVYKAGHHGANSSSSAALLAAVRPQLVIVSAGADNRFGHPHPEMLQRAAAVGATVLRTDKHGSIKISSDGQRLWFQTER